MPDLDILIELSDRYAVDLRELLDGERKKEPIDKEMEETVLKVAEYSSEEKKSSTIIVRIYFISYGKALCIQDAAFGKGTEINHEFVYHYWNHAGRGNHLNRSLHP